MKKTNIHGLIYFYNAIIDKTKFALFINRCYCKAHHQPVMLMRIPSETLDFNQTWRQKQRAFCQEGGNFHDWKHFVSDQLFVNLAVGKFTQIIYLSDRSKPQ